MENSVTDSLVMTLKIRFVTAYTGLHPLKVIQCFETDEYYCHEMFDSSADSPESASGIRDWREYAKYLPRPRKRFELEAYHSFLELVTGLSEIEIESIENAAEIFDHFATDNMLDLAEFVGKQESGQGLPATRGLFALGKLIVRLESESGYLEIRQSDAEPFNLAVAISQDPGYFDETNPQAAWIRTNNLELAELYEALEEVCGTRRQRNELEKNHRITNRNRAEPSRKMKKRIKIQRRRPGAELGTFLCGVQASNNAVLEIRTSKLVGRPYILVEEMPGARAIDSIPFLADDYYSESPEQISIALINIFQLIYLVETLAPLVMTRARYLDLTQPEVPSRGSSKLLD